MKHLDAFCVHAADSLLDALRAIERGSVGMTLVIDDGRRLLGVLTDGDARRALIAGAPLDSPVSKHANRSFLSVDEGRSRAQVLELMQARRLTQVPIVDGEGLLVGLHTLHDILGTAERPNPAVVMAGGRGTRLGSLTDALPKPLIPVAGRPILERIVLQLVEHGIRDIYLSIHYLGHLIEEHFEDGARFGCRIQYLREEKPLGTGGALALLPETPTHPMLVMNGDLITDAHLGAMIDFHAAGPQVATLAVKSYAHRVPFGCVDLDGDRVTGLVEKPNLVREVNAGIYVLDPALLADVPRDAPYQLPELIQACLADQRRVAAYPLRKEWIDVGRPQQLDRARGR